MKPFGRIAVCGMIGAYNAPGGSGHVQNLVEIIARRITMTGFLLMDFEERFDAARRDLAEWHRQGKLVSNETVYEGIENAPAAFLGLFSGKTRGKCWYGWQINVKLLDKKGRSLYRGGTLL